MNNENKNFLKLEFVRETFYGYDVSKNLADNLSDKEKTVCLFEEENKNIVLQLEENTGFKLDKKPFIKNESLSNLIWDLKKYDNTVTLGSETLIDIIKYTHSENKEINHLRLFIIPTEIYSTRFLTKYCKTDRFDTPMEGSIPWSAYIDYSFLNRDPDLLTYLAADIVSCLISIREWEISNTQRPINFEPNAANIIRDEVKNILKSINSKNVSSKDSIDMLCEACIKIGQATNLANTIEAIEGSDHELSYLLSSKNKSTEKFHGKFVSFGTLLMSYLLDVDYQEIRKFLKHINLPPTLGEISCDITTFYALAQKTKGLGNIIEKSKISMDKMKNILSSLNMY